jgi:transcriptional regulator with XRE-family HTH domain
MATVALLVPAPRPYRDTAQLLADARAHADLSQEDAAHAIGVSLTTYGRWERGERRPRGRDANRASKALGIPLDLLRDAPEPEEPLPPSMEGAIAQIAERLSQIEELLRQVLGDDAAEQFAREFEAAEVAERARGGRGRGSSRTSSARGRRASES